MIKLEELLKYFKVLVEEKLTENDENLVKALGNSAIEQVQNNLRPGANIEEGKHNLLLLCVAITYYQYALISAQKHISSIKVGDISLSGNGKKWLDAAKSLKEYYSKVTRKYMKAKFVEFISI